MDSVPDFEDMLFLLDQHKVRYLIVGGLAFIYHAKPRYTKDMDLWVEYSEDNLKRANAALAEFGSPTAFAHGNPDEIVQIGIAPDRIDLILSLEGVSFEDAWEQRVISMYGEAKANWICLEHLLCIKARIDEPRHQEDARVLRAIIQRREEQTNS